MIMRADDFTRTASHSDIALLRQEVANLTRAQASFNILLNLVTIEFSIDGKPGILLLKALPDGEGTAAEVLKRKLIAVGRAQLGGKKPRDMAQIATLMQRGFGHRALAILLNGLSLVGARYDGLKYGVE